MSQPANDTLVITALKQELESIRRLTNIQWSTDTHWRFTGMGRTQAINGLNEALEEINPKRVIILGYAGGLNPRLELGTAKWIHHITDGNTAYTCPVSRLEQFKDVLKINTMAFKLSANLYTADSPVHTIEEKSEAWKRTGADMVDMESAHMACLLEERNIPWLPIRAITDHATQPLPAYLSSLVKANGENDMTEAVSKALLTPWNIPSLIKMGRNSAHASKSIAACFR